MAVGIKGAIDEQGQGKADLMENLEQVQDDQDSVNQKPQKLKEQGEANIEQVSKKIEHLVDLVECHYQIIQFSSSEIKSIVPLVSHEDQIVEIPHIDFIFGDQRWIVNVHDL